MVFLANDVIDGRLLTDVENTFLTLSLLTRGVRGVSSEVRSKKRVSRRVTDDIVPSLLLFHKRIVINKKEIYYIILLFIILKRH